MHGVRGCHSVDLDLSAFVALSACTRLAEARGWLRTIGNPAIGCCNGNRDAARPWFALELGLHSLLGFPSRIVLFVTS